MSTFQLHDDYTIRDGTYTQQVIAIKDIIELVYLFPQYKDLLDSRALNQSHIDVLSNIDPQSLPPVKVVEVNYKGKVHFCLIDGYHRTHAALKRGNESINATTASYDRPNDIIIDYFESNLKHGLTTTKSTRTAYAIILHSLHPDMSLSDIARHVSMNKSSVSRGIKRHQKGDTETDLKTKKDDTPKQIVRTLDRLLTLFSHYGNSNQEIVNNFIKDFCNTYSEANEKSSKAKNMLADFLDISEAMLK